MNYTLKNDCGALNSTIVILDPNCQVIAPNIIYLYESGISSSLIQFKDNSTSDEAIRSWRWIFGDGESYYTTDPGKKNCTHHYSNKGSYYVSLVVENQCRQVFTHNSLVLVTEQKNISGNVWDDTNGDGFSDAGEPNLSGWEIFLDEQTDTGWQIRQHTHTDPEGNYLFSLSTVGGIYRIRENAPDSSWKITNPTNPEMVNTSVPFSVYDKNSISDINFGNIKRINDTFHEVSLYSSRVGTIEAGGYQSWFVTGSVGDITLNRTLYQFRANDRVMTTFLSDVRSGNITIRGDSFDYSPMNMSVKVNGNVLNSDGPISIAIPNYLNYQSTLGIALDPDKSGFVNLVWDGVTVPISRHEKLLIYDLMPSSGPIMDIRLSSNSTIFIGRASRYSII
ncbi:MAG: SdrD B-like domain-containing protein [Methanobacteriota archaeon]